MKNRTWIILLSVLVAIIFFLIFSLDSARNPEPDDPPEIRPQRPRPMVYKMTVYDSAETWQEYFAAALSDPRLKVDSNIVRLMKRKPRKADYAFMYADSTMSKGLKFIEGHKTAFDSAENRFGVDRFYITAVIIVETYFGRFLGDYPVVNALYTACLASKKREKEAGRQLAFHLRYHWWRAEDPFLYKGSWAGAQGMPQFMPLSFIYAIDGDGDGFADLSNPDDAILSIANFLSGNGWRKDSSKSIKKSLKRYNKGSYGPAVLKCASMLKKAEAKTR